MNLATWLKLFKDGLRGAMMSLLPLFMSAFTAPGAWITAIGGGVSIVLGIAAGACKGSATLGGVWLKVANDMIYGILIAFQPIFQTGLSPTAKSGYFISGLLIAALGVITNVINDDFNNTTGILKIVKDLFITVTQALIPALQAGQTAGISLGVTLLAFGHTAFSLAGNVLEADLFGPANPSITATKPSVPATPAANT